MDRGIIFKIKKYAIHDGPGIRTTVFLKGCPLTCGWCHNPEGQVFAPQALKAVHPGPQADHIIGCYASAEEIIQEIEKDIIFYDQSGGGATFSGGEPLTQPAFLAALLQKCREREIHTTLDTSGFADEETFRCALGLADLVLFDLKLMDDTAHRQFTGVSNKGILQNLHVAAEIGIPLRIRVPIIPEITDTKENLAAIAQYLKPLPGLKWIDILPLHKIAAHKYERLGMANPMAGTRPPTGGHMEEIKADFQSSGFHVSIGG